MWIVEEPSIMTRPPEAMPKRDRDYRHVAPFFQLALLSFIVLSLSVVPAGHAAPEAQRSLGGEASGPYDPDLKLGAVCSGAPSQATLLAALPRYIKELVVQWPRIGTRLEASGCVTVARLTIFDHLAVPLTLSFEIHSRALPPPSPDYAVLEDLEMRRAVLWTQPSEEFPTILMSLAGPPAAARDSLERALDFVDGPAFAKRFASLK